MSSPTGVYEMSEARDSQQPAARRERQVVALQHREPGRVPFLFGGPEYSIRQQVSSRNLRDGKQTPRG